MVLIFIGALITALKVTFTFPSGVVLDFFPDFAGFILIHVGVSRLAERETYLTDELYNPVIALRFLIGLSALSWMKDLALSQTGIWMPEFLSILLGSVIPLLLSAFFWISFVRALEQVERKRTVDLVTDYLMLSVVLWKISGALVMVDAFTQGNFWRIILLAGLGAVLFFLIQLFRAVRRYESDRRECGQG